MDRVSPFRSVIIQQNVGNVQCIFRQSRHQREKFSHIISVWHNSFKRKSKKEKEKRKKVGEQRKKVKIGSHTGCFYKIQNTNIKGEKEEKSRGKKRKGKIRRHTGCL